MKFAGLVAAVTLILTAPAMAEDLDFKLINTSSSGVVGVFVSHTGTSQWEENLIDGGVLPSGNQIDVVIADGRDVCDYDIKVSFQDGTSLEDYNLDLCQLGAYTVHDAD